jgi:hypothetical protein
MQIIFMISVPISHKTHRVSIIKTKLLMLFRERIPIFVMRIINTLRSQNAYFFYNAKSGVTYSNHSNVKGYFALMRPDRKTRTCIRCQTSHARPGACTAWFSWPPRSLRSSCRTEVCACGVTRRTEPAVT